MQVANGTSCPTQILVVDQDQNVHEDVKNFVANQWDKSGSSAHLTNGRAAQSALKSGDYDVLICDLSALSDLDEDSESALLKLTSMAPGALVIALSDGGSVSMAMACMRSGAHDYFAKPINLQVIFERIEELSVRHGKRRQFAQIDVADEVTKFEGFVGASPQMQVIYEQISRIAPSSAPVFITGESGTGKEVCAEALHARSPRAGKRFVAINCGAIPRDLMEAELFGVVKGAFTGAMENREGAAELAQGGTLFLDEIGELDLSLQAKLLRFLQTGAINRVGEAMPRELDVRIICATNRNPMQMIAEKTFREDLFYRLHVLPIHLPPLRQRPADIMPIAENFLQAYAREEGKSFIGFDRETAEQFMSREWPGNVRQIQNLIRRIVVMHDGELITSRMVRLADIEGENNVQSQAPSQAHMPNRHAKAAVEKMLPLWRQEQQIIEDALAAFGGNISQAAAALEISPSTIYRKKQSWEKLEAEARARDAA
jgi:two-component system repressor protein LuxO